MGDAVLTWIVESELNVVRYEVELAQSKEGFLAGQFRKIGETPGLGTATGKRQYVFKMKNYSKHVYDIIE
jgi:hypothetical protein